MEKTKPPESVGEESDTHSVDLITFVFVFVLKVLKSSYSVSCRNTTTCLNYCTSRVTDSEQPRKA